MLRATFQHLPGLGARGEAILWTRGITTWEAFRAHPPPAGFGRTRWDRFQEGLQSSERALSSGEAGFFARALPPGEHWRLYRSFPRETAFLDIETTGLSPREGIVTCVTVHGGGRTVSLVQGEDLEELGAVLRRFKLLVTFNGRAFDVPFLATAFPDMAFPPAHADLMHLLRRLGQRGGLKVIEQRLGLGSREGVLGVDGLEAVRLWHAHARGVRGALERLVSYNRADTVNLEPLMEYASAEMERRLLRRPEPEVLPFPTSEARLDPIHRLLHEG